MTTVCENVAGLAAAPQTQWEEAFPRLVADYHAGMLAVARAFLHGSEAEDVVQDAWLAAYGRIGQFAGRSHIRTWLTRIVINQAKMRLRKTDREPLQFFSGLNIDPFGQCFDEAGRWRAPPQHWACQSPEQLLQQQDLSDCILKIMDALPGNQRLVLELRDVQQFELDEICNMLELSAANIRVLLHRARLHLFKEIDHYQETGEC